MFRWTLTIIAVIGVALVSVLILDSMVLRLTVIIAGTCLALWLAEVVPPFVPTLLLWTLTPLFLGTIDPKYSLPTVLSWAADPVLALFFGGFVLGVAAKRHGFDRQLAGMALRSAGGSYAAFLLLVIFLTAFLSMWMSNIAAAVLMLSCMEPVLRKFDIDHMLRRGLLVGIATGANLGGISTPIGTGPNAIAIASVPSTTHISFIGWMGFALPLSVGMLIAGFALIWFRVRAHTYEWPGSIELTNVEKNPVTDTFTGKGNYAFLTVFLVTIILWLTEPWHGVSVGIVALASATVLFLSNLVTKEDLLRIDWSTLLLIAGGITLGKLLEHSGSVKTIAANVPWHDLNVQVVLLLLCFASAVFSALMSNTATAVMLIPLAQAILPEASTAILIAISASFGTPFVISTPQNAMVYGKGGLTFNDLFVPGAIILILGCLIVSLTGRTILNFVGMSN